MSKRIKLGVLGGGGDSLIGVLHRVAAYMYDKYEIVGGVFNPIWEENIGFAEQIDLPTDRIYKDFDTMIESELKLPKEERMEVVSVLTPNFLHYPMAKKLLENDFNVICEKPLTTTYEEAIELEKIYKEKNKVFAVTYTYTGYPMVRQMKEMIAQGELGKIHKIDIQYYQGWINPIIHDEKLRKNTWRLDPEKSGISCCVGDIGTHCFDMLEYVTGLEVKELLADFNYVYSDNKMDVDANILLRFSDYVKGIIRTSQIATAEENNFVVTIYGQNGALKWGQENPNYLYLLQEGKPQQVLKPGHPYTKKFSLDGVKLPPGHPEGIFDSMGNIYRGVANAINKESIYDEAFPTLMDGVRGVKFIEKAVESATNGSTWVKF